MEVYSLTILGALYPFLWFSGNILLRRGECGQTFTEYIFLACVLIVHGNKLGSFTSLLSVWHYAERARTIYMTYTIC